MRIFIKCAQLSEDMGVIKAHIDEGINQITMIDLELVSRFEVKGDTLEQVLGTPITLFVEDVIDDSLHKIRFDGYVFEMTDVSSGQEDNGVFYYTMVVRPKLWMLNYAAHARSFPEMSRIAVVDKLLEEHGFVAETHYKKHYFKEDVYPIFRQLLQNGNSDLSFFRSVLINAGINFFFACDEDAEHTEMLHLIDHFAFFPSVSGEVPVVNSKGMMQGKRRIESISKLVRVVPETIAATVFLADGSTQPITRTGTVNKGGIPTKVSLFLPEGLNDSEVTAKQAAAVVSEGFDASRIVHQGVGDHLQMRPGNRVSIKNYHTADTYKILVTKSHHTFEQTSLAALSPSGSGDVAYRNFFVAAEPLAPIRPIDSWTDIDAQMVLDSALDLDPSGKPSLSPKFKMTPRIMFNAENKTELNTDAIKELMASVTMLQAQVRALRDRVLSLESSRAANGSGFVTAEITEDAWVTDGCELVCMVKAEEFEEPIQVKTSTAWHDQGGGMLHLPRKGNHVWIQRIQHSKGNDWVIVGYRPTSTVASSNNPAKQFKMKIM